jgi:hypothetical protein
LNTAHPSRATPLWLKLAYGGFLCILIPIYWRDYGPGNFLWFSDIALFFTATAVIIERPAWLRPALIGMVAVGVLPLEIAWCLDFALCGKLLGLTAYMFDAGRPLYLRGLSLFHVALPPTAIWMLFRYGYDRRSLVRQVLLMWVVLPVTYVLTEASLNVNWVFGPGNAPQNVIPPLAYLAIEMVALPLFVALPMDRLLRHLVPAPRANET